MPLLYKLCLLHYLAEWTTGPQKLPHFVMSPRALTNHLPNIINCSKNDVILSFVSEKVLLVGRSAKYQPMSHHFSKQIYVWANRILIILVFLRVRNHLSTYIHKHMFNNMNSLSNYQNNVKKIVCDLLIYIYLFFKEFAIYV